MADRTLRGMRIGTHSMETEEGVEFASRFQVTYDCPRGHTIELPFAEEAEIPATWECRCGAKALVRDGVWPAVKAPRPTRTHFDMLLERRTEAELEDLLTERLELLRSRRVRSA